jgi:hypothetical protein
MSNLSDKILSYSPETYVRFNGAYSLTPTNSGTSGTATFTLTNEAPVRNATGGVHGDGSWAINVGNGTNDLTTTMYRMFSNVLAANVPLTDGNYSLGFWFKTNFTYETGKTYNTNIMIAQIGGMGRAMTTQLNGSSGNLGKLTLTVSTGGTVYSTNRVDDQEWHYVAQRSFIDGSGYHTEVYIDGVFIYDLLGTTTTGTAYSQFGTSTRGSTTDSGVLTTFEISDYYIAPYSAIDATAISQIWDARINATNVSYTATPITASADLADPTIAVTAGDHVEITTSILVNAILPTNIAVVAEQYVQVLGPTTLIASIEMINNVDISTGSDISWSALEMTATAEIIEPVLPIAALTASAESGNHTVYVTPSYYALVKQSNPVYYFNFDTATGANYGTMSIASYDKGSTMSTGQASGGDMGLVGAGLSWAGTGNYTNAPNRFRIYPTASSDISDLVASRNFTVEVWSKGEDQVVAGFGNISISKSRITISRLVSRTNPNWPEDGGSQYITEAYIDNSALYKNNDWNHYVVRVAPGSGTNEFVASWYLNGSIAGSITDTLNPSSFTSATWDNFFAGQSGDNIATADYVDEFAIYGSALSNSTIIDHYSFINVLSPDKTIFPSPVTASVQSGTHNFVVNSNATPEITAATASALIVSATVVAGVSNNIAADVLTASATIVQSSTKYGNTSIAETLIAYAESNNAFALSDTYYNYVMANVNPYRYVTFDGSNSFLDYGSDNDYAVAPVTIGGTVVNPDFGINGKSAKTAGTSYITDGVILKESEYNDTWGTGLNNYHSSFWFRKADEDNSTGLRVLWNLNGHYDNQHVILYQYQNKLHLQFNNGSGSYIDQATVSNYNLFDGLRHFVVVAFDHTGSNNRVNLFIDGVDIMTVQLGTYNGTTVNGTVSVPANDEANNHPRLSVGCLITPFGSTSLPVAPTNTIIYVDEVIWAKTSASQTLVSNLYGMMPGQTNKVITTSPITATALATAATTSTSVNYTADWALAESESPDASVSAIRNISINATSLTASAQMNGGAISSPANIIADIMVATAIFNSAGVRITIPGGPMEATIKLANNYINGITVTTNTFNYPISMYNLTSPWAAWLRATEIDGIYPTREVA